MDFRLDCEASDEILDVISSIGRTEDVKFSPSNRRLVLAGYATSQIAVFDIRVELSREIKIVILDYFIISSPSLKFPHGISFIDDDTIIVANREGYVEVFKLPAKGTSRRTINLTPLRTIKGSLLRRLHSPGSVGIYETQSGVCDVLVCNNFTHVVTSHSLEMKGRFRIRNKGVRLQQGLDIPDGISISTNLKWISVSNHGTGTVNVYANTAVTHRLSEPAGVCRGIDCPHGVRFAGNDRYLIVAAAAAPYIHIFESDNGDWSGTRYPTTTVRVLDDETFLRGRYNAEEGGPKGIDVDQTMRVLVSTCEHQILSFFDLQKLLSDERTSSAAA